MTVSEAVEEYVKQKRQEGRAFISAALILRVVCSTYGEIELRSLCSEHLCAFVDEPRVSAPTRMSRFSAVSCFVRYWSLRGEMSHLLVRRPQTQRVKRAPYVYTVQEMKALLKGTEECQRRCKKLSGSTLHAVIATIYSTGATLDEVFSLKVSSIHPRSRYLVFETGAIRGERVIPIGADLHRVLTKHRFATSNAGELDANLFRGQAGDSVSRGYIQERFQRLAKQIGLTDKSDGRSPRLLDIRYTFAVHRLAHWIRQKDDLNEMLPALSMYMGYTSLLKTEEFLAFVPDRFKADLGKLSSSKGRKHWRNDPKLLASLNSM